MTHQPPYPSQGDDSRPGPTASRAYLHCRARDRRATVGAIATWPHSLNWSHMPGSVTGVVLLMLLVSLLAGKT